MVLLLVTYIDYAISEDIRVYPLYFIPTTLAALLGTKNLGLFTALFCSLCWAVSNFLGGAEFSHPLIWVWDILIQWLAFSYIAYLISDLRTSKNLQEKLARIDELTELPNSRSFYESAPSIVELCRRTSSPITIAYIDLDNFKGVNDTYGHSRGDKILRLAAAIMKSNTRECDFLSRLGGDEFVILLLNTPSDGAIIVLERIRKEIERQMQSEAVDVTASIGAVVFTNIPKDFNRLIKSADKVMYDVKNSGRNKVIVQAAELGI